MWHVIKLNHITKRHKRYFSHCKVSQRLALSHTLFGVVSSAVAMVNRMAWRDWMLIAIAMILPVAWPPFPGDSVTPWGEFVLKISDIQKNSWTTPWATTKKAGKIDSRSVIYSCCLLDPHDFKRFTSLTLVEGTAPAGRASRIPGFS